MELQGSKNPKRRPQPSPEFLAALSQEMALTAETMNLQLSELQNIGYLEALSDLSVTEIRAGFKRARKTSNFFPKPIEVRELANDQLEEENKSYFQLEPPPIEGAKDKQILKNLMDTFWAEHEKKSPEAMPGQRWTAEDGWKPREESWRLELEREARQKPVVAWHAPITGPNIRP